MPGTTPRARAGLDEPGQQPGVVADPQQLATDPFRQVAGMARPSGPGPKTVVVVIRLASPTPITSSTWETNRCLRPPIAVSSSTVT